MIHTASSLSCFRKCAKKITNLKSFIIGSTAIVTAFVQHQQILASFQVDFLLAFQFIKENVACDLFILSD